MISLYLLSYLSCFNYHSLPSSCRISFCIYYKKFTTTYLHFSYPGLCALYFLHFTSACYKPHNMLLLSQLTIFLKDLINKKIFFIFIYLYLSVLIVLVYKSRFPYSVILVKGLPLPFLVTQLYMVCTFEKFFIQPFNSKDISLSKEFQSLSYRVK